MRYSYLIVLAVLAFSNVFAEDLVIRPVDAYGNVQYNKPYQVVTSDGKVITVDQYGNRQYNQPQHQITKSPSSTTKPTTPKKK